MTFQTALLIRCQYQRKQGIWTGKFIFNKEETVLRHPYVQQRTHDNT